MSFFDDASWVLIPEGIKEDVVYAQKPTNGLGDLTFTRASDATRTNSAGVVERTPWNLFTQSVWTGGGALPTGWSYSFNTGTSAPVTSLYSTTNVAYSFVTSSTRQVFNQSLSYITGQSYHLSVLVEAVSGSVRIDQVLYFNATGTQTFFKDGVPANASDFVVAGSRYAAVIVSAVTTSQQVRIGNGCVGNSTGTVVLSQPQLVEGTDAKPYFATTNRQDVPRLDYRNADGTLSTCPRLLLEPQRTNSIRNSTMVGAVAGSPGTLPTNWSTPVGLTQTIVGLGTENGLQYIDLRYSGTSTVSSLVVPFETSSAIAAANAQNWTNSFYVKLIAQPSPPVSYNLYTVQRVSGAAGGQFVQAFTPTTSLVRYTQTVTTNNASITHIQPYFLASVVNGQTYDFTIRIAAPQMELGAYATTFIPTTTAAVTRVLDGFTRGNIFTNGLISSAGGTWLIDLSGNTAIARDNGSGLYIGDSTTPNSGNQLIIRMAVTSAVRLAIIRYVGGVFTNLYTTIADNSKIILRWNGTVVDVFVNGALVSSGNSFTTTVMQNLGCVPGVPFNINQSSLFPVPMTDAQCIQLTT